MKKILFALVAAMALSEFAATAQAYPVYGYGYYRPYGYRAGYRGYYRPYPYGYAYPGGYWYGGYPAYSYSPGYYPGYYAPRYYGYYGPPRRYWSGYRGYW